ncbi:TolC family protein [Paludisphaera mucosa]|uniref:TolC family protein n=1 Tax=Paludisphaera mucosa TaxID=3030827 RepID=A0ABT6FKQ4_9BACT|nr:TolC family protein [Paludisphaera mucosa]MDG3008163.1 TolC family protein [Paludisphaera mucosa]
MKPTIRAARALLAAGALALLAAGRPCVAQGPTVDVQGPPGMLGSRGRLGAPIGSAGISAFDATPGSQQDRPIGGRLGPSASRAPVGALSPSTAIQSREPSARFQPRALEPANVPRYGELELPAGPQAADRPGGLTLDGAIERLVQQNLNLLALRHEIDQAQADVLTASLRANPALYADTQFVPYGRFSRDRPGGPTQYDLNITYPVDVSRKRRARTEAAVKAKRVTEAQFQDAVRLQIDNLYTAYVDVVAAEETLRYSRAYAAGITKLLNLNRELLEKGQITESTTDALGAQVEQAQFQVREATQALGRTTRALAVVLNIPRAGAESLQVQATLRDVAELPTPLESLIETALASRPDLNAYRLGVTRADADVKLAHAERYSDVYVLAQPYTYQDNRPFGLKSPTSWAVGVTVPLPLYNRNQGNIARAKSNASQTRIELAEIERQVANEAEEAVREFELSRDGVLELEGEVLPASRKVRDAAFRRFQGGEADALEYLEAQRQYNDAVRQYRDGLVRHRRAMLDLNTAVGSRILP